MECPPILLMQSSLLDPIGSQAEHLTRKILDFEPEGQRAISLFTGRLAVCPGSLLELQ